MRQKIIARLTVIVAFYSVADLKRTHLANKAFAEAFQKRPTSIVCLPFGASDCLVGNWVGDRWVHQISL